MNKEDLIRIGEDFVAIYDVVFQQLAAIKHRKLTQEAGACKAVNQSLTMPRK